MPADVSPKMTTLHLGLYFRSPCGVLRQFPAPESELDLAVAQWEKAFRAQIYDRLSLFANWHANQP